MEEFGKLLVNQKFLEVTRYLIIVVLIKERLFLIIWTFNCLSHRIVFQYNLVFTNEEIFVLLEELDIHMSHFSYACKMRYPLNLVLESWEYLWFY